MNITDAQKIVQSRDSSYTSQVFAVSVIAHSTEAIIQDLIDCLSLGGLPAEIAATHLHHETGRLRPIGEAVLDAGDWIQYCKAHEIRLDQQLVKQHLA